MFKSFIPIPDFFVELFAKASISDVSTKRDYAKKLLRDKMETPSVIAKMTRDDFKDLEIPKGHGIALVEAAQAMLKPQPQSAPVVETQILDKSKPTIMISYQWDTQPSAFVVRDYLLAQERFNVIIDQSGIHGNFLTWMDWAVSNSHVVIILASRKYNESMNCEREACRAAELRKKIVPVRLEADFMAEKWLASTIAGLLYYDGSTKAKLEESLRTIVDRELPKNV